MCSLPSYGGTSRKLSTFLQTALSRNSKKVYFQRNVEYLFGKWAYVQLPKIFPEGTWGPRIMKAKKLTQTPKNCEKIG